MFVIITKPSFLLFLECKKRDWPARLRDSDRRGEYASVSSAVVGRDGRIVSSQSHATV